MSTPSRTTTPERERVEALDGLRAVAIGLVVAFHLPFGFGSLDTAIFRGGFIGVDVFFVLSGFLITLVLLPPGRREAPSLRRFLARRVTRLVPAFAGLLLVAAAVGTLRLAGTGAEDLWRQLVLAATAAINWPFALGAPAPATFVSHTWSLALEWQWYVAWSIVVWSAVRLGARRQVLMYGALIGAALVAVWRSVYWGTGIAEERLYYGFDTRGLDGFLVGAVVALALQLYGAPTSRAAIRATAIAAGAALATLVGVALTQPTRDEFWYRDAGLGIVALAAGALVFYGASAQQGVLRAVLASPPVLGLGRISYSVYLWHWPVFVLTSAERTGWTFTTAVAVRLPLTLAVSALSYFLLERPFLRRRARSRVADSLPAEPSDRGEGTGDGPEKENDPAASGHRLATEDRNQNLRETGRRRERGQRGQARRQAVERDGDSPDEEQHDVSTVRNGQRRLSA